MLTLMQTPPIETAARWLDYGAMGLIAFLLILLVRWMLATLEKRLDSHAEGLKALAASIHELAECVRMQQVETKGMLTELIRMNERLRYQIKNHDEGRAPEPGGQT